MAIPSYMNLTPHYSQIMATDATSIITQFRTQTVTNGGWDEPSAGVFKCPVTAGGRFFEIELTASDADTLQGVVTDQNGSTICTVKANIETAPLLTQVRIFSSEYYCHIDITRNSTTVHEFLRAGMLDPYPIDEAAVSTYVYGHGSRNSTGSVASNALSYLFMSDSGSIKERVANCTGMTQTVYLYQSLSGAWIFRPTFVYEQNNTLIYGRLYGHYYCSPLIASGAVFDIPIDASTTAQFMCPAGPFPSHTNQLVMTDGSA